MTLAEMFWIDMETTGLEANRDVPLELGFRLTDRWGEMVAETKWLVWEEDDKAFMKGVDRGLKNEYVKKMHDESGLWADLEAFATMTRDEVDRAAVEWLTSKGIEPLTLPMCGNSIGSLDRPFTLIHFPKLNGFLHYRNIDMSSIKEVCKLVNPTLYERLYPIIGSKEDAEHRVLSDIDASIIEYKAYIDNFLWIEESD